MPDENSSAPNAAPRRFRWEDLGTMKVTPVVFLAFFGLLAVMSGAAAIVGYTVHLMARPVPHHQQP